MEIFIKKCHEGFVFFLDLLFPRKKTVTQITTLSAEALASLLAIRTRDNITSLFPYRHPLITALVWEIKYKQNQALAEKAALIIKDILLEELADEMMLRTMVRPLFIPIPISKAKRRARGYNQTELIASHLHKMLKTEVVEVRTDILTKTHDTTSQTKMATRQKRIANVEGSFTVTRPELVVGRDVILFDDVVTTGATLREASRVLTKRGARRILALTLAY